MLVCIPTNGDAGLEDTVCEHFGSAPYFTLYDSSEDAVNVVRNRNAHHSHGTCHPMNQLAKYHIDGIVCSGIGRRAIEALESEGITVYYASSERVADVVDDVKAGRLTKVDPVRACRGQGQRAGFVHGFSGGRGRNRGQGGGMGRGQGGGMGRGRGW